MGNMTTSIKLTLSTTNNKKSTLMTIFHINLE